MQQLKADMGDQTASKLNNYRVLSKAGSGGYGKVYLAIDLESSAKVAIKHIRLSHCKSEEVYRKLLIMTIREVEILMKLSKMKDNFYTVKLVDAFTTDQANEDNSKFSDLFIVTDYYENNLCEILHS